MPAIRNLDVEIDLDVPFPQTPPAHAMEYPRADTHAPDLGVGMLGEQALRCSESIVGDDVVTTVDIDGNDLSPVGWLDQASDLPFVQSIATLGSLLGGIAGSPGRHTISPLGVTESCVTSVAIIQESARRKRGDMTAALSR